MRQTTDLLDPTALPQFSAMTPRAVEAALDLALERYEGVVADLVRTGSWRFDDLWLPLERAETVLDVFWASVSHLNAMTADPGLRRVHAEGEARLVAATTRVRQDEDLYRLLTALRRSAGFADRPEADQAAVSAMIRDFELSGVGLSPGPRARYAEIASQLTALACGFADAVQAATEAWFEQVTDPSVLAGLPQASLAAFSAAAQARGLEGWLITLQDADVGAVLGHAGDRGLRRRVYEAFGTRASDQGPHAGLFDNSRRIDRILALRREAALLLGFATPADWSLASKMAPDAAGVTVFLKALADRARPAAEAELAEVRAFAAARLGIPDLEPWDLAFVSCRLKEERFAALEPAGPVWFPLDQVLEGWKALLADLFGLELVERRDVDLWSADARFLDVLDAHGVTIAGLYLDLHGRAGKRGGAWMAPIRSRLDDGPLTRLPVASLTCNFAPRADNGLCLLSHAEIVTLLHETGHALHHLLTRGDRPNVAGTAGVEWDALEWPSQLLEEFAWDYGVLRRMSRHVVTGEPLPEAAFERLIAARRFQAGMTLLHQVELSLFDICLHEGEAAADPTAVLDAVREEAAVVLPPKHHRFAHGFVHIFAGLYAGGYYSYLWSEGLAAAGFGRFADRGLLDRETGRSFREEVLARGASRPAEVSFRAFLGQAQDAAALMSALLTRRGLPT